MGHLPGVGGAGEDAGRPPRRGQESAPNPPPPKHMRTKTAVPSLRASQAGKKESKRSVFIWHCF